MTHSRVKHTLSRLATYDFSPEFSAKVRRFFYHPLGLLCGAAAVALLCGFFLHAQGFILFGGILVVVALGVSWPWLSLRGLVAELQFERSRGTEGEAIEATLSIRNLLPWSAWGLAVRGGFSDDANEVVVAVASAPRRRTILCRWLFKPLHRGVYPTRAPLLTTGFPFGLWEKRRVISCETPLIVWPRTFPVGPIPPADASRLVEGNVSRGRVGSYGDVVGVRPYRRGDSLRRIHWGQSARHDRLIVCELQTNSRPVIQLVLDTNRAVHFTSEDQQQASLEWSIRIVASFARGWLEDGAQVGLAAGTIDIAPASGQAQLHQILDALARVPKDATQPLDELLACPRCQGFRDGLQIIVTTDRRNPDEPTNNGCHVCRVETERYVVLKQQAFVENKQVPVANQRHFGITPWLTVDSIEEIPTLLRGGWQEARHGS